MSDQAKQPIPARESEQLSLTQFAVGEGNPTSNLFPELLDGNPTSVPEKKEPEQKDEKENSTAKEGNEDNAEESIKQEQNGDEWKTRYDEAQSFIGKQGNEIGELRKQTKLLTEQLEGLVKLQQSSQQEKAPYYQQLMEASEEELSKLLDQEASDPENAKKEARFLKTAVKIANDMIADKLQPFQADREYADKVKTYQQRESDFLKDKQDWNAKKPYMKAFIDKIYGGQIPDPLTNSDAYFAMAQAAYGAADMLISSAKSEVTKEDNRKTVAKRALNSGSSSAPQAQIPKQKKQDPFDTAIDQAFNGIDWGLKD